MDFLRVSSGRRGRAPLGIGTIGGLLAMVALGCSDGDGFSDSRGGLRVVTSKSMLSEDAETAKAAGWTTEMVHYDFVEDGVLKGGVAEIPSAPPTLESKFLAAAPLWNVETLRDNGPSSNRIDIVVVGDGYTSADLPTYHTHVESVVTSFFLEAPLSAYSGLFNVHRVDVISNESGVDNDPTQGISRDTALDMQYWCGGTERLLCINTSKAVTAASEAPDVDQILAVANSSKYGGAGYTSSDLGTLAGGSANAVELALHEFGHSFADLADEYEYDGPATWPGGEPREANVSIHTATDMAAMSLKWFRWLDEPQVDTFEGAKYSMYGIYRPTSNSKMRALNRPFEAVNVEQFILFMYQTVDPIDDASPAGTYDENDTLSVVPITLSQHAMDVQWKLNGADIPGAIRNTLDLGGLGLAEGAYLVSVTVVDNTDMVRDEARRASVMTSTRSWTVEIGGGPDVCGDGECGPTEDCDGCPEDCGACPTCDDGAQNGGETDIDCGGGDCPKCDIGKQCVLDTDCVTGFCEDAVCESANGRISIPARIEAEDYVRYYDTTPGNSGGGCHTGDDVDKEPTSDNDGVCNVGWIAAGEWLEYDITVAATRAFDITARLAANNWGKSCRIEIDGVDVTGTLWAPGRGWQTFEDRTATGVIIGAGDHVVRVYMYTDYLNINYIEFQPSAISFCGDDVCDPSEDCGACPEDCGVCPEVCGDDVCDPSEDCTVCPEDCGACPDVCGDDVCGADEDCDTCPEDCGECAVGCTCPSGCDAIVRQSAPFTKDGPGNTCYFFYGSAGNFINSWNDNEVNLNGVDITNIWIGKNNYPSMIDGGYYLFYDGDYPWSHVEVKY